MRDFHHSIMIKRINLSHRGSLKKLYDDINELEIEKISHDSLSKKFSRGTYSADFLDNSLKAINIDMCLSIMVFDLLTFHIEDIIKIISKNNNVNYDEEVKNFIYKKYKLMGQPELANYIYSTLSTIIEKINLRVQ